MFSNDVRISQGVAADLYGDPPQTLPYHRHDNPLLHHLRNPQRPDHRQHPQHHVRPDRPTHLHPLDWGPHYDHDAGMDNESMG